MIQLGILITSLLIFIGILKSKSKVIFVFQCFWLWIIQAFNCGGMDYKANEWIYSEGGIPNEWLTSFVIKFFLANDIDYMWYRTLWATVCVFIFGFIVLKYSKRPCIVAILYWSFLWADNIAQCRFFWAACTILLAFHFWIKGNIKLYYIFCLVATGFHSSVFIYLGFPILSRLIAYNTKLKNIGIIVLEMLFLPLLPVILDKLGFEYISKKFLHYLYTDNYSSIIAGICFLFLYLAFYFCIFWILSRRKDWTSFEKVTYKILNTSVFILPFFLYNSNFGRFYRPILILTYIVISNRIGKYKRGTLSQSLLFSFVAITVFAGIVLQYKANWFAFDLLFYNNYVLQMFF